MQVLICDDHELYREGLKQLLNDHFCADAIQVFEAADMQDSLAQITNNHFSLILFDLTMPGSCGVNEISRLKTLTDAPIVVVSADTHPNTLRKASSFGAKGYISKCLDSNELLASISIALQGGESFPQEVKFTSKQDGVQLTKRQLSVLECLVAGMSNREIADSLYLSEGTVKQYVSLILRFLEVDNRTQAAIKGAEVLQQNNQ